jgi:predicted dehydrogenase
MQAIWRTGAASVAAVADCDVERADAAAAAVACDYPCAGLAELLSRPLDGVVIATPTALHAEQVETVLEHGIPVFCQKPLGRTLTETRRLIDLARDRDLNLGVDMSYRHLAAVGAARRALEAGEIGQPFAAELVFHNAYGPDKAWARDPELSGGGALIDLGCHLVDLARLFLGGLRVDSLRADLFSAGDPVDVGSGRVEDLALAQISLESGRVLRLACSWWLPAGTDAVIEASFIGEGRALTVRNVDGSFYDFEALLIDGRRSERLAAPPDEWGGRALVRWAQRVARDRSFDDEIEHLVPVAELIDRIYGRPV